MVTVSRLTGLASVAFAASLLFSAQSVTHASASAQGAMADRQAGVQNNTIDVRFAKC